MEGKMLNILKNTEWGKVVSGGLIATAGAALTYLSEWVGGSDFGNMTPIVVVVLSVLVNAVRKLIIAFVEYPPTRI